MIVGTEEELALLRSAPRPELVVDIVGDFRMRDKFEQVPFRHISGPQPDYECGGWIEQTSRHPVQFGDTCVVSLACRKCHSRFLIKIGNASDTSQFTFDMLHAFALIKKALQHFTGRRPGGEVIFTLYQQGGRDGVVWVRGIALDASPELDRLLCEASLELMELREQLTSDLAESIRLIEKTRSFLPNKKLRKAKELAERSLSFLREPFRVKWYLRIKDLQRPRGVRVTVG